MATDVTVRWQGDGLRFEGTAGSGAVSFGSGADPEGGGVTPMETVLLALGACTGMDVVSILTKMRQPVEEFGVEVRGEKREEHPRVYTAVEVVYRLRGDLDEAKVRRAIGLSETRYCPVEAMLGPDGADHFEFRHRDGESAAAPASAHGRPHHAHFTVSPLLRGVALLYDATRVTCGP